MRYLERHHLIGRHLLTTDAAAGYVILEHYPEQRVFIDDRYDMYPRSVIYDYFDLTAAKPDWSLDLDRYDVDVVGAGKDSALAALLDSRRAGSGSTATQATRSGCAPAPERSGKSGASARTILVALIPVGRVHHGYSPRRTREFLERQPLFFVAYLQPVDSAGHVNVSPKGRRAPSGCWARTGGLPRSHGQQYRNHRPTCARTASP